MMSIRVAVKALPAESIAPKSGASPSPAGRMVPSSARLEEDQLVGVDGDGEAWWMMQALPHAWLLGTIRTDASSESCLRWLASVVEDEGDVGSARRMTVRMAVMLDSVRGL